MRSLGLDIGDRWIGVALSDPGGILATPFTIIARTGDIKDIEAILDIINQQEVGQIVVGLPFSMDGTVGHQAAKVKSFTRDLISRTGVSIEFRDERLTTVSARRLMRSVRKKKAREKVRDDAVAAALILQGYLDEI